MKRRTVLALLLSTALPVPLRAQDKSAEKVWRHGVSLMGEPKYPAGFAKYDYANPNAPKGGTLRLSADGTFDSLNIVPTRGNIAMGVTLVYDTLMVRADDEIATQYGLLAEAMSYPEDFASVTYRLSPKARWHDGKPVTPEDVVFSFEVLTANNPQQKLYYGHVKSVAKTGEREVTFTFDSAGNRELPQIVGELQILPKHWWEGTDAEGRKRDVTQTSLEAPLGSGPYRIKAVAPGRSITYERVADYWAGDLNANVGRNNFAEIRYEYFRDDTVELEAFKADQFDWRQEVSAKNWATAYDFPAVKEKKVLLETFPMRNIGLMQGFFFNLRRPQFQDQRVRRAFALLLDFEEMNKLLFFGQYERPKSYFHGSELASSGLPQGLEKEILESVRGKVPDDLFTKPYVIPTGGSQDAARANLREATRLLKEAGYEFKDRKLVNAKTGEPFRFELLINGPTFERHGLFYKQALDRLGIDMTIRTVDSSQYIARIRSREYDMIIVAVAQSLSPGNEQRFFWGSAAADQPGSRNYGGIKNPAVDALIERVIFAKTREELVAASRALDRVLLWNDYVVPGWTSLTQRIARWDRFGKPEKLPEYSVGFPDFWWWDADKAAKLGAR